MRRALLGLEHPKLKTRNFVELGMIPDVRVEDGRVVVTLALPVRQTPAREQFQQMVQATARAACPGWPVEVAVREMAPEERASFSACAEGRAPAVEQCGVPMLGHLPLDPELAVKCDQGKIEDYESESFEGIAERVLDAAGLELSPPAGERVAVTPGAAR